MRRLILMFLAAATPASPLAEVYQQPADFLADVFDRSVPDPRHLWLTGPLAEGYRQITGRDPRQLRLRYWAADGRSVWVLEAIGKERPITAGFVVAAGRLQEARVLAFRESRGFEIRYPFFTEQFSGLSLTEDRQLDRPVDGISGATLSVRAMSRMARLALWLDRRQREAP